MDGWRRLRDWHEVAFGTALHQVPPERLQSIGQIERCGAVWNAQAPLLQALHRAGGPPA